MKTESKVSLFLLFISTIAFAQNTITMVSPPTTVEAGTDVDITFNYTKDAAEAQIWAFIRFKDGSGNLTDVSVKLSESSGTETLSLEIPTESPAGGGYSYQAQLFSTGWAHLFTENIGGVTVETAANSIIMVNPPTTVQAGTDVDITFNYRKDVAEAWAFIRFKDRSGNLTDVSMLVSDDSGTETLSLEIPAASNAGGGYSYQAQLFTTGWDELVTQNFEGISVEKAPTPGERISPGANWKYYDLGNEPSGHWKSIDFDDTAWNSGDAELGYGEGDEATVLNTSTTTAYFRKSFEASNEDVELTFIDMSALRDDGMVVYLNGTEIWRDNMPSTSVSYETNALGAAAEGIWVHKIINNSLAEGTNVVAVEIHQNVATSSDISFDFRFEVRDKVQPELSRGPYLQKGSSNAITIKYRTNVNTETVINYGTSLGALSNSVSDAVVKNNHEIELTGLEPNTKYYYEIADDSGAYVTESEELFFKTAPLVGTDQFVRAWILGDAGTGNQNQKNVRDQYYQYVENTSNNPKQTDMMLFLGDNAYDSGLDEEYQYALFDIYDTYLKNTVAWSTLGNHDGYNADSNSQTGPYYDIFTFPTAGESGGVASGTEAYYSFDYANIHFIVLESYTLDENETQIAWCKEDIQNTNQDWIVAIFHHPAYTKGSHDSDNEPQLINMRNNFLPILEANGVDLILSGHSHSYERSYFLNGHYGLSSSFDSNTHTVGANGDLSGKADTADGAYQKTQDQNPGAVYITTGSAGKVSGGDLNHNAMYASLNELGSCVLEIENDDSGGQDLTVKFINDNGVVSDYFTINKAGLLLSTEINAQENTASIYPVPSKGILNIKVSATESLQEINIYNEIGKRVKTTTGNQINVNTIPSGIYVVQIITDKGEHFKSIIVE